MNKFQHSAHPVLLIGEFLKPGFSVFNSMYFSIIMSCKCYFYGVFVNEIFLERPEPSLKKNIKPYI